ncbi:MAG: carbonic anhydrase [Spirochaetes bacterium GWF1_31_7]|nr:MAG: carbonic anhydrase [Spirochaetes bacterium GWE1_32_154]OHD45306.1 MAG: carbonic anhydrase [Spirochaetes bacterium GWE2_31_10]OHD50954.1 MAG: carbonic anhydrase [Spirochaetes bacterium GWF1_31_7]HBD95582.1 carbonic anhydrase [Spirochaetia bacterium]HBI37272.1 carbonic anhydrase [Spirochaetia bacterium]
MDRLLQGIVNFSNSDFAKYKDLFVELKDQQNPHTLFIGCSDSRVIPNLITQTLPGELFTVRNIANIVPPYRETEEYVATTSAIEYAVQVLGVENIVVCGHSNCGGCSALYKESDTFEHIPHVQKWLELASPVKEKVLNALNTGENTPETRSWMTEQVNIVEQIKHLLTYPFITDKYIEGKLKILGWYYIIETGEVYNYNKETGCFELISG